MLSPSTVALYRFRSCSAGGLVTRPFSVYLDPWHGHRISPHLLLYLRVHCSWVQIALNAVTDFFPVRINRTFVVLNFKITPPLILESGLSCFHSALSIPGVFFRGILTF